MFAIILFTVFLGVSCGTSFDLDNQLLYFVEPPPPLSNGITSGKTDIAQCSQFTEQGVFFGKEGGYAFLSPQFVVGMSFSFELELKPRTTKTAVLLSVGVLKFLSLQLLNGTVKFAVDNGAGMESVIYDPTSSSNALCDGHWHQIKIIKKKNLITLNVDGKSNLHIMKEEDPETKPGRSCKELINECATDSHDCSPPALYNSPEQAERIKRNKKKIHGLVHVSGLCVLFVDNHQIYIRHVPIRVIHKFTLFQVACLAILWTIKSIKSTSIAFGIMDSSEIVLAFGRLESSDLSSSAHSDLHGTRAEVVLSKSSNDIHRRPFFGWHCPSDCPRRCHHSAPSVERLFGARIGQNRFIAQRMFGHCKSGQSKGPNCAGHPSRLYGGGLRLGEGPSAEGILEIMCRRRLRGFVA